jgi:hypothetical protein
VARRRGNHVRRNGGNKGCEYGEAYVRLFPEVPELLV